MRDEGLYAGKIRFYVLEVTSDEIRQQIAGWEGLGNHGLVGTTAGGELKVKIPGHNFGRTQIVEKANQLVAMTARP